MELVLTPEKLEQASTTGTLSETGENKFFSGLYFREFELWIDPPDRYNYYPNFYLYHPQIFELEIRESPKRFKSGKKYDVGIIRPDGVFQCKYGTLDEPKIPDFIDENKLNIYAARLTHWLRWHRNTLEISINRDYDWLGFDMVLAPTEVEAIESLRQTITNSWKAKSADWIQREKDRTNAIAVACASESLPASNSLLECLECGAVFDEPGHVELGGMCCDHCR